MTVSGPGARFRRQSGSVNPCILSRLNLIPRLLIPLLLLVGCASTPPVQEMSDARQAVQVAQAAGAQTSAPQAFATAQRLLDDAGKALAEHRYPEARDYALKARAAAIRAREQSAKNTLQ